MNREMNRNLAALVSWLPTLDAIRTLEATGFGNLGSYLLVSNALRQSAQFAWLPFVDNYRTFLNGNDFLALRALDEVYGLAKCA